VRDWRHAHRYQLQLKRPFVPDGRLATFSVGPRWQQISITGGSKALYPALRIPAKQRFSQILAQSRFLIAILVVVAILAASQVIPGLAYLLLPGILLSYLISHSSDTSNFSFVASIHLQAKECTNFAFKARCNHFIE
jgi:hypothetical protein